jgi:hypothetical protein
MSSPVFGPKGKEAAVFVSRSTAATAKWEAAPKNNVGTVWSSTAKEVASFKDTTGNKEDKEDRKMFH